MAFFRRANAGNFGSQIDPKVEAIVKENTTFALDLYKALQEREENVFFSPYSISSALAMTYAGAKGETAQQMAQTLHFASEQLHADFCALATALKAAQQSAGISLKIANALYPQKNYPFLDAFLNLISQNYEAEVTALDYMQNPEAARNTINGQVAAQTEGKIQELIPAGELNDLTRLVLANAIYFKGDWAHPFECGKTTTAPFWLSPERSCQVPMMRQTQTLAYANMEDLQALELPYAGEHLSMLILLPKQRDGLTALERNLTVENLDLWTKYLAPQEVQVSLPCFKIECCLKLHDILPGMGMSNAFDPAPDKANFSGMDGQENWLFISAIFHQAFVEVNEEGSEAAAATAVVMSLRGISLPEVFQADRPFIFLIRERRTDNVLFLGRFAQPEPASLQETKE